MSISIHIARKDEELDLAFQLRHDVFVEETRTFPPTGDGRIIDRFDCYRGTTIIIARDNAEAGRPCIATLRFAPLGPLGLPSDSYFDFGDIIRARQAEGHFATMGMYAVHKAYRGRRLARGLILGLCKVAWRELRRSQVRFIVAPCLEPMRRILEHMGGHATGDPVQHGNPPFEITPMFMDMEKIGPMYREGSVDPANLLVEQLDERRLFQKGDVMVRQGDSGHEAYLIMYGTARVHIDDAETPFLVGPGELVGELALLGDDGKRTATLIVESEVLDVGVISRLEFRERMHRDAEFNDRVLRLLLRHLRTKRDFGQPDEEMKRQNREQIAAQVLLRASKSGKKPVAVKWLKENVGFRRDDLEQLLDLWHSEGVAIQTDEDTLEVSNARYLLDLAKHLDPAYTAESGKYTSPRAMSGDD